MNDTATLQKEYASLVEQHRAAETRIASLTFWERPSPDSVNGQVLAGLEAKRDRIAPRIIELAGILPAKPSALDVRSSDAIRFKGHDWQPVGTHFIDHSTIPDLPACLRRARA